MLSLIDEMIGKSSKTVDQSGTLPYSSLATAGDGGSHWGGVGVLNTQHYSY
jgi:hypothetical protein